VLTAKRFWEAATLLSEYRDDCKVRFSCILRDRWKKLRTIIVSQNTLKTLGPMPALYTSSFDKKCKFVLVSRRSVGSPLPLGPIRRIGQIGLKLALFECVEASVPEFSEILFGFSTYQNFWGCACTPSTPLSSYILCGRCVLQQKVLRRPVKTAKRPTIGPMPTVCRPLVSGANHCNIQRQSQSYHVSAIYAWLRLSFVSAICGWVALRCVWMW